MICNEYCNSILDDLKGMSPDINLVLAHESGIKSVPVSKPYVAVGIKKFVISPAIVQKNEDGAEISDGSRKLTVTVSVNIYAPYKEGTQGSTKILDTVFDTLLEKKRGSFIEARLLGTKYSRETQSLVSETEFVFENYISDIIEGPPITDLG